MAEVSRYSNVVTLADCNEIPCFAYEKTPPPGPPHPITDNRYRLYYVNGVDHARHNEGANLGFLDGHVKWYPKSKTYVEFGVPDNHEHDITWQPIP
jgi:prepilin-type processing-associated H-X9-DG protein